MWDGISKFFWPDKLQDSIDAIDKKIKEDCTRFAKYSDDGSLEVIPPTQTAIRLPVGVPIVFVVDKKEVDHFCVKSTITVNGIDIHVNKDLMRGKSPNRMPISHVFNTDDFLKIGLQKNQEFILTIVAEVNENDRTHCIFVTLVD